jgi:hypothetical protein
MAANPFSLCVDLIALTELLSKRLLGTHVFLICKSAHWICNIRTAFFIRTSNISRGIHSQDLIALAEGNKDVRLDGTIHWDKFRLMGECIMAIIKLQQLKHDYSITPDPMILVWIAQSQLLTDEVRPPPKSTPFLYSSIFLCMI